MIQSKRQLWPEPLRHRGAIKPRRRTAVDQVIKSSSLAGDLSDILDLATKFDRKDFLPSIGDIREFLTMTGNSVEGVNSRTEGFRYLLPVLAQLPPERLKQLASSNSYSGPAQLGPLADAIRSTGEAIRRGNQESTIDPTTTSNDGRSEEIGPVPTGGSAITPEPSKTHSHEDKSSTNVVGEPNEQSADPIDTEADATLDKKPETNSC
jgi:hypothetical protein